MRIIVDNLSDGHNDLFLKIDAVPSKLIVADSYYLQDFFGLHLASVEQLAAKLLEYWRDKLCNSKKVVFLPFDLSDQYIRGFYVEKKKDKYVLSEVYTENLVGFSTTQETLDVQVENIEFKKGKDLPFLIGDVFLLEKIDDNIKALARE